MRRFLSRGLSLILILFVLFWPIWALMRLDEITNQEKKEVEEIPWHGVIKMWDFPRLNSDTGSRYGWILDKIRRFEKENPGVYIDFTPIDWHSGPIKLEVAQKMGNSPDIAPVATDFIYMNEDTLEPLGDFISKDEMNQFKYQAVSAVTYDNKIWGMPFMMTTYAMYINLDLFRQKNVEPPIDGNWTYDEFVEKMKVLTFDEDNDGALDHFGLMSFIAPNYYNLWGILLSDGAEIMDNNNNYIFYDDKAIKGLNKVKDLKYKYKVMPETFGHANENEAWDLFAKEQKVAVYPTGSWAARVLERSYFQGKGFDFAIANYPIGDRRIPISLNNNISAYGIFKQEDEKKLKMCVKFLKFVTQDKYQKQLEELGVFSAKKGIKDMYLNNPKMKRLEDCLSYTKVIPRHEKWKDIDRVLQNQIRLAITDKKSSEDALVEAKNQIEQILNHK